MLARLVYRREALAQVWTIQRHIEEETECRDCAVDLGHPLPGETLAY